MYSAPIEQMDVTLRAMTTSGNMGQESAEVLTQCARLAERVWAKSNREGDRIGARLDLAHAHSRVELPASFTESFSAFVDGGWQGISHAPEHGGAGLAAPIVALCREMFNSANLSLALLPVLADGVVEALEANGTDGQRRMYVDNLVSGKWAGAMDLTEPQAGSDLSKIQTRAEPMVDDNGCFRLFGQKIFITYGEHSLTENIIHLVLAKTLGAPEGVKGISMFICPKFLVNEDGSLGNRNDIKCISIEEKLGLHGSPTCTLQFGDGAGAIGSLVGEIGRGLEYMFIMMNSARFQVAVQSLGVAEAAYQKAAAYAAERVQGRDRISGQSVPIEQHADVQRMLVHMRSLVSGARALIVHAADLREREHANPAFQKEYDWLIPVLKGWCTEMAQEVTYTAVQVFGGMGFIEETGIAQFARDARILPIYEGTNGIQAIDLCDRKTQRDHGLTASAVLARVFDVCTRMEASECPKICACAIEFRRATESATDALATMLQLVPGAGSAAVPFLRLMGTLLCGYGLAQLALNGECPSVQLQTTQVINLVYFSDHLLPAVHAHAHAVRYGTRFLD